MKTPLEATGQTSVLLAIDMAQFLKRSLWLEFDRLRTTTAFIEKLQTFPQYVNAYHKDAFFLEEKESYEFTGCNNNYNSNPITSHKLLDNGALFGVFRYRLREEYYGPLYLIHMHDESQDKSDPINQLYNNNIFRKHFLNDDQNDIKWQIYVRLSSFGVLVFHFERIYRQSTPVLEMALHVTNLQERLELDPNDKVSSPIRTLQRRIATAVGEYIMNLLWQHLKDKGGTNPPPNKRSREIKSTNTTPPKGRRESDYFVMYRFDVIAEKGSVPRFSFPRTHYSRDPRLKREFVALTETIVLQEGSQPLELPAHRASFIEEVKNNDLATWNDETCVLTPRVAIIVPSKHAYKKAHIMVGDMCTHDTDGDGDTRLTYADYCRTLERMIELVIEIHLFTQILESWSSDILYQNLEHTTQSITGIFLPYDLIRRQKEAATLSRLLASCQRWSNPQNWSRAEYTFKKAQHLFNQLGMSSSLEFIETNTHNINSIVRQELAERSNHLSLVISLLLGLVFLYSLPSFWADSVSFSDIADDFNKLLNTTIIGNIVFLAGCLLTLSITFLPLTIIIGYLISSRIYKRIPKVDVDVTEK